MSSECSRYLSKRGSSACAKDAPSLIDATESPGALCIVGEGTAAFQDPTGARVGSLERGGSSRSAAWLSALECPMTLRSRLEAQRVRVDGLPLGTRHREVEKRVLVAMLHSWVLRELVVSLARPSEPDGEARDPIGGARCDPAKNT